MANDEKVLRLLSDGRVKPDPAPAYVFNIEGDHGNYVTVVGAHVAMCSCPATVRCTHIDAAVTRVNATARELLLLDEAVARRKRLRAEEADALFARLGV